MTDPSPPPSPGWPDLLDARQEAFRLKLSAFDGIGWSPLLRQSYGYNTPDEWYDATILSLVNEHTDWLDVGCGHELLPGNAPLAALLAARCHYLVGIDPSENIERNELVHERSRCTVEEFHTSRRFDLVSMRMVAEHVTDPRAAVAALARLVAPGGRVVIYTVSKWSPSSLVAAATPMAVHHAVKSMLWRTSPEDTFPTAYRMNTRATLRRLFGEGGFDEETFLRLDDCRSLARWRSTAGLELRLWRILRRIGLPYPEACLLGIYRRRADPAVAAHAA